MELGKDVFSGCGLVDVLMLGIIVFSLPIGYRMNQELLKQSIKKMERQIKEQQEIIDRLKKFEGIPYGIYTTAWKQLNPIVDSTR